MRDEIITTVLSLGAYAAILEQRQRGRVRRYIAVLTQRKQTTVYQL
jgi:hypothetical protein